MREVAFDFNKEMLLSAMVLAGTSGPNELVGV